MLGQISFAVAARAVLLYGAFSLFTTAAGTVQAQGLDLGGLIKRVPGAPNARQVQRVIEQASSGQGCDRLKQWAGALPPAAAPGRPDDLLRYVDDGVFHAHFGKTYDQLTIDDFRSAQTAQRECQRQGVFTPAEQRVVATVWNQHTHARLAQQLVAARGQRSQAVALGQELDRLQPTEADYRRIDAIKSSADSLSRSLPAGERSFLAQKIDQARARIGPPVEQQRVSQAIASAQGSTGLAALAKLHSELGRAALGPAGAEPLRAQLRTRIAELEPEVVAAERATSPLSVGSAAGLPTLEQGKIWLAGFNQRYQPVLAVSPALAALRQEVIAQRRAQIVASEAQLASQLRSAAGPGEVSSMLARYLTSEEQSEGAGRVLKAIADERAGEMQKVARNESVFGPQPGPQVLGAALPQARAHPSVTRCDELAADPQDPTRAAAGVSDDALAAGPALAACNDAVQVAPELARARFQQGRALLKAGRERDAVAAFQQAAKSNHPGALAYLATAHEFGAGGLPKSQQRRDELNQQAAARGYGTGAQAAAGAGGRAPASPQDLKGRYEQPDLVKAVYFGDASLLPNEPLFVAKYALTQAEILSEECKSFTLAETRNFQDSLLKRFLPKDQNELMLAGAQSIMSMLQVAADMQRNPQSMVEYGRREQRLEDAPTYAARDIVEFTKQHGACGTAPLARYTTNLRNYFERGQARR